MEKIPMNICGIVAEYNPFHRGHRYHLEKTRQKLGEDTPMQDTVVGEGCDLEYVITDKNVTISADKEIKGTNTFPVYAAKFQKI